MKIRVFLIEDHPAMRQTLAEYLALSPDIELCGTAASAREALAGLDACDPSAVLVDLSLPDTSGLDLLAVIRERWQVPCIVLSGHGEASYVGRALAAGARGYILKGRPHEVPDGVRRVLGGEIYLSELLRAALEREATDRGT